MSRVLARCTTYPVTLATAMLLAFASPAFAARTIGYTYLEAAYSVDSTIQAYGQSYDSDDSYRIDGSYQFNRHVFATARYYSAGYDFEGNSDFGFSGYSLGAGYKGRIGGKDAMPFEWFAVLSYEHNRTHSQLQDVNHDENRDGSGLKVGIRTAINHRLELTVSACEQSFGGDFLRRDGDLDGLSFELSGVLDLRDHWSLTTTYRTGELDYLTLPNYPSKYKLELDRDEVFVGVRWAFE